MSRRGSGLLVVLLLAWLPAGSAHAFSIFRGFGPTTPELLQAAARWTGGTGGTGLDDGLQVGLDAGLGAALSSIGVTAAEAEAAVLAGIQAWSVGRTVLHFDTEFDIARRSHHEIFLEAVSGSHPVFAGNGFFGLADVRTRQRVRTLPNGTTSLGQEIWLGLVYFNVDRLQILLALPHDRRIDILTRLTIHEFGHTLGLGHPNDNNQFGAQVHYDTDDDPFNRMVVDPNDPYAGIRPSLFPDNEALMSNAPCGIPPVLCAASSYTALRADDLNGRDVLYAPEPGALGLLGCAWLALRRRRLTRASADACRAGSGSAS